MKTIIRISVTALLILTMSLGTTLALYDDGVTASVSIQDKNYVIKNGNLVVETYNTSKILVKKVYKYRGLVGAGNYLYFVKKTKSGKQGIYGYNLISGKVKFIKTGKYIKLFETDYPRIYYGQAVNYEADQEGCYNLYALDLKSRKKSFIEGNVGEMRIVGENFLTLGHKTHAINTELNRFNMDGSGKKHICDAVYYYIYASKVYYYALVEEDGKEAVMKYYTCDFDGKNVTEITEKEYLQHE